MDSSLLPIEVLLERISAFSQGISEEAVALLKQDRLRIIAQEYEQVHRKCDVDLGFNIFSMVSEVYYRENFHSDVLRAMLNPKSPHNCGRDFLGLFIDFLVDKHNANIQQRNYLNTRVEREEGRIDILIADEGSKRAIIIENKINGAVDRQKQLLRYLEYAISRGYEVDAIVYLRLGRGAGPNMAGWKPEEEAEVLQKLRCLSAYDGTELDLLKGWLRPCERAAEYRDPNARYIFKQYAELITNLGKGVMNKQIIGKFYSVMMEGDGEKYRTAQSLVKMLGELVPYRVERIIETFRDELLPFRQLGNYRDYDAFFTDCDWRGANLSIDVIVELDWYHFEFWDRGDDRGENGRAQAALEKLNRLQDFIPGRRGFVRDFEFPRQEQELIDYIREFKAQLGEMLAASQTSAL